MNLKSCWCANQDLKEFSPDYLRCSQCGTLILNQELSLNDVRVKDDEHELYSKEYWLSYQTEAYGYPDIRQRSRQDIHELCLYWLHTLMSYKLPPGRVLEIGCAHGGSVALAKWAGFEAMGLEMSPWVVDFAQKIFDIPMLLGPLEDQNIEIESFNAILLYDVLEHLPDPLATMSYAASLLKEDGVFIIQTPNYLEDKTYSEMLTTQDKFLDQLKPSEHVYLFNHSSVSKLFKQIGFEFIKFEQQLFDYDMYFVASRQSLVKNTDEQIAHQLMKTSSGRLILALTDKDKRLRQIEEDCKMAQKNYQESSKTVEKQQVILAELTAQKDNLIREIDHEQTYLQQVQAQWSESCKELLQAKSALTEKLAETRSQLQQLQAQFEQKELQLCQYKAKLEQVDLQWNQARLQNQKYEQERSEQIRQQLYTLQGEIEAVNGEIEAMKTSKFWRLKW